MKTNLIKDLVVRPNTKVKLNDWDPDYLSNHTSSGVSLCTRASITSS